MIRRLFVWALLAVAAAVMTLSPNGAWACSCKDVSERQVFESADATFIGVATATERVNEDLARTTFAVSHVWKGDLGATVLVETGLGSHDCPFDFVPGTRYAIFADGDLARGLRTDSCSNPSDLDTIERARLRMEDCTVEEPDDCVIARYDAAATVSPEPLAVDGPGVGPGAPRSGPIAAAGVLLLASAIGTYAAYRSQSHRTSRSAPGPR